VAKAKSITGLKRHAPTGVNARIIALTRLEELYRWAEYVNEPYNIDELHDLRIAAKRLRYTLEIFADALPAACEPLRKEVEQIQEELGALHDSDVMIALLRLCLGSQDSGSGYSYLLTKATRLHAKGNYVMNPELLAHLLDSGVTPSAEQRQGLELLLHDLQKRREEQYKTFRQHWHQLEYREFRKELFTVLHL
jgi:CHAD domain-containing protein